MAASEVGRVAAARQAPLMGPMGPRGPPGRGGRGRGGAGGIGGRGGMRGRGGVGVEGRWGGRGRNGRRGGVWWGRLPADRGGNSPDLRKRWLAFLRRRLLQGASSRSVSTPPRRSQP